MDPSSFRRRCLVPHPHELETGLTSEERAIFGRSLKRQRRQDTSAKSRGGLGNEIVDEEDLATLPNDVEAGILSLRADFPAQELKEWKILAVIFQSQLYGILADRSFVDHQLDVLCHDGQIRIFEFGWWKNDRGIMVSNDYVWLIRDLASREKCEDSRRVLSEFATCVETVSVWRRTALSIHDLDVMSIGDIQEPERILIQIGLLIRNCHDELRFSVPNIGRLLSRRLAGDKQLLRLIRRKMYEEILLDDLEKTSVRASGFGTRFHLRDVVGLDLVEIIDTTEGALVRPTPLADEFLESKSKG